ncbi:probable leucine-rich repeat receptor-like protein kinase At1g68400 [Morus notabilis]|uniref:probable leucine-rich repeat receptor-like protein kinase At1g68400 n=1 Tax=Morus notabilis TaxID=981085 RepID=UPI000CECF6FE|nr:probable leucine-rich repeat receptor-like protein kinase At1g68400 [Morus notabilis]
MKFVNHKLAFLISLFLLIQTPSIFSVVAIIKEEFYPDERDALIQLRDSVTSNLDLHSKWTGPPCHENDTNWVGISCSNGHVVHIVLEGIELKGSLPSTFPQNITYLTKLSFTNNSLSGHLPNLSNLFDLEYVSLSHNTIWGPIPLEFIQLPKLNTLQLQQNYLYGEIPPFDQPTLTVFNVSYNHLGGQIPNTSVLQKFPNTSYGNNPGLCGTPLENPCSFPPPPPSPPSPIPPVSPPNNKRSLGSRDVILIAVAAGFIPILVVLGFLFYYKVVHRREKKKEIRSGEICNGIAEERMPSSPKSRRDPELSVELEFFDKEMPAFDLDDLLRSSAEVLGKGTLGTSYKTTLETGQNLVVKRLKDMKELSKKEFVQQMQLLGKKRHENLARIVSFYYSKDEKLVIYEFVPDGTLFELLHENRGVGRVPLSWAERLSIIKDIAKALTFLHHSLPHHRVPHANLKSSNVLIQRNPQNCCHSKLTDFGFLPLLMSSSKSSDNRMLAVANSPEYAQGRKLSHKADVYCFGVVLLEIITGRIPGEISPVSQETMEDLSDWVRMVVNTDWSTDILDVEIVNAREGHDEMLKLTEIALECTDDVPEKRPKMSEVLQRIEQIEQKQERMNE